MYCEKCGHKCSKRSKFCSHCGTPIHISTNKNRKKAMRRTVVVVLIVSIIIISLLSLAVVKHCEAIRIEENIFNAINAEWSKVITADAPAYLNAINEVSSYDIISIEEGEVYTIKVVVDSVDLGTKLKEAPLEAFPKTQDETAINKYLLDLIDDCKRLETTTEIYAAPENSGYTIYFSDEFVDAMSGGVYSYTQDLIRDLMGE